MKKKLLALLLTLVMLLNMMPTVTAADDADHDHADAVCTDAGCDDHDHDMLAATPRSGDCAHANMSDWLHYSDTQHFRSCLDCGREASYEYGEHIGGTATCTSYAECQVCGSDYGELNATNHNWGDWYWLNGSIHARSCKNCPAEEEVNHSGGTATCITNAICEVCNDVYGELDRTRHGEYSDWGYYNGTQHYRYCLDCFDPAFYEYEDHYGGTATCSVPAFCEVCNQPYGPFGDHTGMTAWVHYSDEQHYRRCLECGSPESYEYEDHYGGDGSCRPTCEVCGERYYDADGEHRSMSDWNYYDGEQHFRWCLDCCDPVSHEYEDHHGGTSTCTELARCEGCSYLYGDFSDEHLNMSEWYYFDTTQHRRCCLDCYSEASYEYSEHTGGTATCSSYAECQVCGSDYGEPAPDNHAWGEWESNGNGTHTRVCLNDATHTDTEDCSGSTGLTCDTCGYTRPQYRYSITYLGSPGSGFWMKEMTSTEPAVNMTVMISFAPGAGPTYAGHTFTGQWKDQAGNVYKNGDKVALTADSRSITLYAQYEKLQTTCDTEGHDLIYTPASDTTHKVECSRKAECNRQDTYEQHQDNAEKTACEQCKAYKYSLMYVPGFGSPSWGSVWYSADGTSTRSITNDVPTCSGGTFAYWTDGGIYRAGDTYTLKVGNQTARLYAVYDHDGPCSGDDNANCSTYGTCQYCRKKYLEPDKHSWGEWESNDDGTHTHTCLNDASHTETEDCTGGDGSCMPICEGCGEAYIPLSGTHQWGEWTPNADGTHTRVCALNADHTETADCTWGDWTHLTHIHHERRCTVCNAQELGEHTGGTLTCYSPRICDVCNEGYGSPDNSGLSGHPNPVIEQKPATCYDEGYYRITCDHPGCSAPFTEFIFPANGQHLYNHWNILGDNMHHTDCAQCGENTDVACTLWELYEGETLLTVCPVCGDFAEALFEVLLARDDAAVPIGTLLVRGLADPIDGALFGFTVAGVYGGEVVDIHGPVTITIPVECESFTVVRVEIVDDAEVRTEIPFTLDNGQLTIETATAGLFLLVPAE